jgi:hypothetical protein
MFPQTRSGKRRGNNEMTCPPPWKEGAPPKDRPFLAVAFAKGTPDLHGRDHPSRIVAEWDSNNHEFRPVKVEGDTITGIDLHIICWTDLPLMPQIE